MVETTAAMGNERPFRSSVIDRFNRWVVTLPIRALPFFAVFAFVLIAIQMLFLWLDGGLQKVELLPVIIFNGFITPFVLALIPFLDRQAVVALDALRPVLDTTETEFEQYRYRLSNMPARAPLIAGLTFLVVVILTERLGYMYVPIRYAALEQLPVFAIVFHVVDKSTAFLFGVIIYHSIRQLRLVNTITLHHTRISLFHLGPLQAFSKLTALTAVALVVGIYGWMLINPELLTDPISLGFVVAITTMAAAVFVWPLFGVHRLIAVEKERTLHALDLRFETAFTRFNEELGNGDTPTLERLNGTIASLELQRTRIKAIPTWPWKTETAQFAVTAITLPLVMAILRFLIERAFGL